jgi:hypothetical protein
MLGASKFLGLGAGLRDTSQAARAEATDETACPLQSLLSGHRAVCLWGSVYAAADLGFDLAPKALKPKP